MSITDELREYARIHQPYKSELYNAQCADEITAIADRIDAEHERQLGVLYRDMSDAEWVRLPKDADGVPVRIGDKMETERFGVVEVEGFIHNAIAFNVYDPQPARICTVPANQCRHHHAPTVEDVLREFALAVCKDDALTIRKDVVDEYAAKLRLAEGEDA